MREWGTTRRHPERVERPRRAEGSRGRCQFTNSPTHQLTNSPTHQLTNSPTHELTNSRRIQLDPHQPALQPALVRRIEPLRGNRALDRRHGLVHRAEVA